MSEISKEELIGKISLEYEKNKSQILAAVKNCNGEFSIVEMEKELDDFYSEEEMPNVSFTYDKGSIECFYFPDDVILEIINSIPRDIKKLTVSDRVARMIDFSEFNLEEVIVISRYTQADDITYKLHHDCKISRVGNYCYDYYDYLKDGNDFYYKAQHLTNEEVLEAIKNIDQIEEEYKERYDQFYNRFCHLDDGNASKRCVERVFFNKKDE